MSNLVQKLSQGEHPVEITGRPHRNLQAIKECLQRNFIHVRFTDTQGGTELGIRLDQNASELNADFDQGKGKIKLVGNLTLDYQKVQVVALIDLASFKGEGHLALLQSPATGTQM
jgi:hypothetical protein